MNSDKSPERPFGEGMSLIYKSQAKTLCPVVAAVNAPHSSFYKNVLNVQIEEGVEGDGGNYRIPCGLGECGLRLTLGEDDRPLALDPINCSRYQSDETT